MSHAQVNNFTGVVHLGTDHAGFALKEQIKEKLIARGYRVIDDGALSFDVADDYPHTVRPTARSVSQDQSARAIIFGKSGQGEAMVANRIPGVRAAVYTGGNLALIPLTREHNDANVLSIAAGFVSEHEALEAVELFLNTSFSGEERHTRRINAIDE